VIQEIAFDGAVEDHDPNIAVGLKLVDNGLELSDRLRAHDVEWRVVDDDAPVGGRASGETNPRVDWLSVHESLLLAMRTPSQSHPRFGLALDDGVAETMVSVGTPR
jgi:hypothetical protein